MSLSVTNIPLNNCSAAEIFAKSTSLFLVHVTHCALSLAAIYLYYKAMKRMTDKSKKLFNLHTNLKIIFLLGSLFYIILSIFDFFLHFYYLILYMIKFSDSCNYLIVAWKCAFFKIPLMFCTIGFTVFHAIVFFERSCATFYVKIYEKIKIHNYSLQTAYQIKENVLSIQLIFPLALVHSSIFLTYLVFMSVGKSFIVFSTALDFIIFIETATLITSAYILITIITFLNLISRAEKQIEAKNIPSVESTDSAKSMRPKKKSVGQAKKQKDNEPDIKQEQDDFLTTSNQTIATPSLDFSLQQLASQALGATPSQSNERQQQHQSPASAARNASQTSPTSEHQSPGIAVLAPRFGWGRPAVIRPSILSRAKPIRNSADVEDEEDESMDVPARPYRPRVVMIDKNGGVFGNNVEQPEPAVPFCNNCAFEFPNLKKSLVRLNQGVDQMIAYVAEAMKKDEQIKRDENLKSQYFSKHFVHPSCELDPRKFRKKYTRTKPVGKRGKYKPRIKMVNAQQDGQNTEQDDEDEEEEDEDEEEQDGEEQERQEHSSSYYEDEPIATIQPFNQFNQRSIPSMPLYSQVVIPDKLRPGYGENLYGIMPSDFFPKDREKYNYMNVERFRELSSDYALKAMTNTRNDWGQALRKQLLMEWGWWEMPYNETFAFVPPEGLLAFRKRFIAFWQLLHQRPKKNALKNMFVRLGQHRDYFQFSELPSLEERNAMGLEVPVLLQ
uniref:Uncharacterized protein n=1 Tax=Ditylenchus dipsaci TaxID=166011 RepID=A0A915DU02_9BILA